MRVDVLLFEGFDELDAIAPYEVFRLAARRDGVDARLVTVTPADRVEARSGLRVEPDGTVSDSPEALVVPGGGWNDPDGPGVRREYDRGDLPEVIADAFAAGATVASVCTGAMLLAAAGLLEGRPATTHHTALADLRDTGCVAREARFVDDGRVLTAGGITSGIDLALHLVERECGPDVAASVARELEYERDV
ncbi:PfpI family protease [Natronomonas moolapensis 8.8.11]|uniref:PfpI family protease n=1 Tax=Natronomonas moolapensis (strain DSM 18674 / CECT 7526 / JCM 14361 / 8.8.11) TaxID=268739 RepID=M1XTI0_NATM8|nr:DJ-1/PfpI family protein [Natronomonas moolapensis]CCQ37810.1 PfpI family protease [Natronomonas moolapensis 8.8.11]